MNHLEPTGSAAHPTDVSSERPRAVESRRRIVVIERKGADLVLLDLNLPGMDGLEVCRTSASDFKALPFLNENTANSAIAPIFLGISRHSSRSRNSR